jgi:hypothetical protein
LFARMPSGSEMVLGEERSKTILALEKSLESMVRSIEEKWVVGRWVGETDL